PYLSFVYQLLQESGVVHYFIVTAQLGIVITEYIEAVGAGRYDLFYAIAIQQLYIILGHHLENKFIAGPAGGIAGAAFLLAQYGKADARLIQYGGKCFSDLLCALVKAA